jgi:Protein of unknown function (DUF1838)
MSKLIVMLSLALLTGAPVFATVNLQDEKQSIETFVRMRGNTAGKDAVTYWKGNVYAMVPDQKPQLLFGFEGYNVARMIKQKDGSWQMLSREYAVYKDPKTGAILEEWTNPFTNEKNAIFNVQNDPVNNSFGGFVMPFREMGQDVILGFDVPLGYPNPIQPKDYPAESTGEMYVGSEHFGFFAKRRDIENRKLKSVPTTFSWARQSPWMPWMKLGDKPGTLMFSAWGKKLPSVLALPKDLREYVARKAPKFLTAPTTYVEPNATSWTEYKKQILEPASAGDKK